MSHDAHAGKMSNKRVRDDGTYVSVPRPDLEAHQNSLILPMPDLLSTLTSKIGRKLTAYVASVDDVKTIERWIAGERSPKDAERRLRFYLSDRNDPNDRGYTSGSTSLVDGGKPWTRRPGAGAPDKRRQPRSSGRPYCASGESFFRRWMIKTA